jgi:hypothetical protein
MYFLMLIKMPFIISISQTLSVHYVEAPTPMETLRKECALCQLQDSTNLCMFCRLTSDSPSNGIRDWPTERTEDFDSWHCLEEKEAQNVEWSFKSNEV